MMTCSRNLCKHLKNCCQTKTNMKMFQHSFQFFANLMTSISQKKRSNFLFIFIFHVCAKFQKKNKMIMTCVFECFQSHCHILKELHEFFCMMVERIT
jgi:predicted O-linked N-acetylglucosamine transferase (SPINDLY family)